MTTETLTAPVAAPAAPPLAPPLAPDHVTIRDAWGRPYPRQPLSWGGTMMAVACGILMSMVLSTVLFVLFWGTLVATIAGAVGGSHQP